MNGEIKHIPKSDTEMLGCLIIALAEHYNLYVTKNTKYWLNIQYNSPESIEKDKGADDEAD